MRRKRYYSAFCGEEKEDQIQKNNLGSVYSDEASRARGVPQSSARDAIVQLRQPFYLFSNVKETF